MKSWAGWTLNHKKAEQRAYHGETEPADKDLSLHQGDPAIGGEDGGRDQPGQPIQPIGKVDCVRHGHDDEGCNRDVQPAQFDLEA